MSTRHLAAIVSGLALMPAACELAGDPETTSLEDVDPAVLLAAPELTSLALSPDGSAALVTTNATGRLEPLIVDLSDGTARPAVSGTRSMRGVSWFPDGSRVLLSADRDGDEQHHLFVARAGDSPRDITPGENRRAQFLGWSADGASLYVSDNVRDPSYADIYQLDARSFEGRLLYRDTLGLEFGAISPAGSHVALYRPATQIGGAIWVVETGGAAAAPLESDSGVVEGLPLAFTLDGRGLVISSGSGREFDRLEQIDLGTKHRTVMYQPDWDVTDAQRAGEDGWLISVNEDAYTRLYMQVGGAPAEGLAVPDSLSVTEARFHAESGRLAFLATSGRRPAVLFVQEEEGGAAVGYAPESESGHEGVRPERVRFPALDGIEIPGLLYRPIADAPRGGWPVVLRAHGGPGGQARVRYSGQIQYLVSAGYLVLEVNNRGSTGYGDTFWHLDDQKHGEADLDDYVAAKQWLGDQTDADTSRVAIMGSSYGGYLVLAALAFRPDVFAAGVDLYGISDWVRTIENIPPWWEPFRPALEREMGPFEDLEFFRAKSPLHHASRIRRPLIVLQGANDPRVLQQESDAIVEAVRAQGVPVEYVLFEDEGHGFTRRENRVRALREIRAFLDRHLARPARPHP